MHESISQIRRITIFVFLRSEGLKIRPKKLEPYRGTSAHFAPSREFPSWTRESGKLLPVRKVHRRGRARRSRAAIDVRRCATKLRACVRVWASARTHGTVSCERGRTNQTLECMYRIVVFAFASGAINRFSFHKYLESSRVIGAYSLSLFQMLRREEYRRLRGCVCDDTHTELSGREVTLGDTATTKSRAVT